MKRDKSVKDGPRRVHDDGRSSSKKEEEREAGAKKESKEKNKKKVKKEEEEVSEEDISEEDSGSSSRGKRRAKTISVFYSTREPSPQGELNYHRFETCPMPGLSVLKTLQKLVEGDIELIPHKKGGNAPFMGYANESGLAKDLRRNDLAGGALEQLGFEVFHLPLGCAYAGTVVVMGNNERGLTVAQKEAIEMAIRDYRAA